MAQIMRYNLQKFADITFEGFNFTLPEETIKIISELSLQVGSPSYVKTPVFQKRENPLKPTSQLNVLNNKRRKGKNIEVVNDEDWETLRTFHPTKFDQNTGIDAHIDLIRSHLNKITDKNYIDYRNKIIDVIEQILVENYNSDEFMKVGLNIFEIASNNRFYSKIYADLYSELITKYEPMRNVFENSFNKFTDLFNVIEYVDPLVDYDKFCKINKNNEKRRALSSFFVNLTINGIIQKPQIMDLIVNLLTQVSSFISQENKKNEVDELTENIVLLYKKEVIDKNESQLIEGITINELIDKLAHSKTKSFPSLTSKSIFKYMDMFEYAF
jgi:hypothetical protein